MNCRSHHQEMALHGLAALQALQALQALHKNSLLHKNRNSCKNYKRLLEPLNSSEQEKEPERISPDPLPVRAFPRNALRPENA